MKKETSTDKSSTIRTIKTGNCSSSSGKSKLTYLIGCGLESDIHFRIHSNTGNGFFNNDWMPLKTILELLGKAGSTFTSFSLNPLLKGRSNNTPAFLVASLLEEGIVHRSLSQKRCYELSDVTVFMSKIKASIESNSDIKEDIKTSKKKPVMASLFTE
ncbi:MAG: hypothetical protein QX191_05750 [Methylococcaceae bacterium]